MIQSVLVKKVLIFYNFFPPTAAKDAGDNLLNHSPTSRAEAPTLAPKHHRSAAGSNAASKQKHATSSSHKPAGASGKGSHVPTTGAERKGSRAPSGVAERKGSHPPTTDTGGKRKHSNAPTSGATNQPHHSHKVITFLLYLINVLFPGVYKIHVICCKTTETFRII